MKELGEIGTTMIFYTQLGCKLRSLHYNLNFVICIFFVNQRSLSLVLIKLISIYLSKQLYHKDGHRPNVGSNQSRVRVEIRIPTNIAEPQNQEGYLADDSGTDKATEKMVDLSNSFGLYLLKAEVFENVCNSTVDRQIALLSFPS